MTWICRRAITGLQYTPFEFDQPEDYSGSELSPFRLGEQPSLPPAYIHSATQTKKSSGRLPDVLTERTHHICNQRFKDLVDSFEPGLHFFNPIEMKRNSGEIMGQYYLWTIGQDIDCILTGGLDDYWRPATADREEFQFSKLCRDATKLVHGDELNKRRTVRISKQAVAGRHLWTGGLLAIGVSPFFMSDDLASAWKGQKFSALDFLGKAEEVDIPWNPVANMGPELTAWRKREAMIAECWPKTPNRHGEPLRWRRTDTKDIT